MPFKLWGRTGKRASDLRTAAAAAPVKPTAAAAGAAAPFPVSTAPLQRSADDDVLGLDPSWLATARDDGAHQPWFQATDASWRSAARAAA